MAGFWNGLKTGFFDLITLGGYSKEKEREKQEELNKLQMEREDNAYQRTVEDMNKAGLNPLTMSGTNNAQPLTNPIKSENNTFDKAVQLATTISGVATGLAQAKNLNASTAGMGIQNALAQKDLDYLNKKGLSPSEYEHLKQKELADLNKGFWGKIGNDVYERTGEKINELIDKGANVVEEGIESLGKGEFKDAVKNEFNNTWDKKADEVAEEYGAFGSAVKEYAVKKKQKDLNNWEKKMYKAKEELDKASNWNKTPTQEQIREVNRLREEYNKAKEKVKEINGKHWRDYL